MDNIAKYIDHTILKADATANDIKKLCKEAKEYGFMSVCINPSFVALATKELKGSDVLVCTVVGFPLGATSYESKAFEAQTAIEAGAKEVDMVINIGALKDKQYKTVENDIRMVVKAAEMRKAVVKVIIETCYLTEEEKIKACQLAEKAGADFVKTSTGFGTLGATVEDIKLMKSVVGDRVKIKAAGGIRDYATAKVMIDAGADRIGASAGIKIVEESKK